MHKSARMTLRRPAAHADIIALRRMIGKPRARRRRHGGRGFRFETAGPALVSGAAAPAPAARSATSKATKQQPMTGREMRKVAEQQHQQDGQGDAITPPISKKRDQARPERRQARPRRISTNTTCSSSRPCAAPAG